jgi:hypothetical protein
MIMSRFRLPCIEATRLIEKRGVVPLSIKQRLRLYIHIKLCKACKAYEMYGQLLDSILSSHLSTSSAKNKISDERIQKIIEAIEKQAQKS